MCLCMHACVYVHVCACVCMHVHVCVHGFVCVHVCAWLCVCVLGAGDGKGALRWRFESVVSICLPIGFASGASCCNVTEMST